MYRNAIRSPGFVSVGLRVKKRTCRLGDFSAHFHVLENINLWNFLFSRGLANKRIETTRFYCTTFRTGPVLLLVRGSLSRQHI